MNKRRSHKAGMSPGSLIYTGNKPSQPVVITVHRYQPGSFEVSTPANVAEAVAEIKPDWNIWINVDGVHDPAIIQSLGNHFQLHPLTPEDIVSTDQRPKREEFGHYLYVVLRMMALDAKGNLASEQISLICGKDFLLSFQEAGHARDIFDPVRNRLKSSQSRISRQGPDYLLYALLDTIVDNYFIILEDLGDKIEKFEHELVSNPSPTLLKELYRYKRTSLALRKNIWPLREVINALLRDECPLIERSTTVFFRDVYDHCVQIIDTLESYREMFSSMLDVYLSSLSNRMNNVMKFLTLIATIFMPLTFISSIYGMNFDKMPELKWEYGYPFALGLMAAVALGMVAYFRYRRWL
jgi:magnesium transporter